MTATGSRPTFREHGLTITVGDNGDPRVTLASDCYVSVSSWLRAARWILVTFGEDKA